MTTTLFVRRFLADYARNGVNLLLLVVVPVVFVVVAAGPMADAAELLGGPGRPDGPAVQVATAGWAAGFLAGIAMYFQTRSARAADRRLVLSGLAPARLVGARLAAGLLLAVLAATAALIALAARTGIDAPARVLLGTLMFAIVYLAIGALVGALMRNPVNGSVLILFIWIIDVFFGPAISGTSRPVTRALPTHFLTLWMVDLPSQHGGRLGDLGWALTWTLGGAAVAFMVVAAASRVARTHRSRAGSLRGQLTTGARLGLRNYRRNVVLLVLLVVVPVVFVLLAVATTPDETTALTLIENGRKTALQFDLQKIHGGTMAPVAIASLAALAGLFVILDTRIADRRLALAGFRVSALLTARLAVIGAATVVTVVTTLAITAAVFDARQWTIYAGGNIMVAATYALLGALLGPIFGRVGGTFIAFLVPFLDLGIAQSPMLRDQPAVWAHALPAYGSYQVLLDGGLTATFDTTGPLLAAVAWLAALAIAVALVVRRGLRAAPTASGGG